MTAPRGARLDGQHDGCLPVVEGRFLVGILTERDFLRFAIKTIEQYD